MLYQRASCSPRARDLRAPPTAAPPGLGLAAQSGSLFKILGWIEEMQAVLQESEQGQWLRIRPLLVRREEGE